MCFKTQKQLKVRSEKSLPLSLIFSHKLHCLETAGVNLFFIYPIRDSFSALKSKHKQTYITGKIVNVSEKCIDGLSL